MEAGTTTSVDLNLEVGAISDRVTVVAAPPLIRQTDHQVSGVVTRDQIDSLPLNGRSFL